MITNTTSTFTKNKLPSLLMLVFILFALTGCGHSKKEERQSAECLTADWWSIGYEDGSRGVSPEYFTRHRKTCAQYGVTADITAWLDGRDEGMRNYCKPQNGYRLGAGGYRYENGCPPELEGPFLDAHSDGFGLYQRRMAAQEASERLNNARQRSKDLEFIIANKTKAMLLPDTSVLDRPEMVVEIKQLTEEKAKLSKTIPQLQSEYDAAQREYEQYQANITARYK